MNRKGYEINYITNTITVSKKFLEQASTLGGDTYETMKALRKLGIPTFSCGRFSKVCCKEL